MFRLETEAGSRNPVAESDRLELLLSGQQAIFARIHEGGSLEEILDRIAALAEQVFASAYCAISLIDRDTRAVRRRAASGLPSEIEAIARNGGAAEPAEAAAEGARVLIGDFAADLRWPEHGGRALAAGYRACWAEPIPGPDGRTVGALALYHPEPRTPMAGEARVLAALAQSAGALLAAASRRPDGRTGDHFGSLVAAMPGVVYQRVVKPDGEIRYTYISEGAYELFGVTAEEILSNPNALFSCHSPDYRANFRERLLAASRALTVWDVEASIITCDGRKKYTHAIARPERRPDGSVLWTGVILDTTRTREAVFETLSQGFLLYDADDRLVLRNSHYLNLYPGMGDIAVPGAAYRGVALGELGGGTDAERIEQTPEFRRRIEQHRDAHSMFERQLDGDRWLLINEHRTRDGGTVVLYTDISELKRRDRQIRHLAYHDALTGIPNRVLFTQRIEQALTRARKRGATTAVMVLDLDRFKNVNDSYGHAAGDALLKCVAERLRGCLRDTDTIARLGGDEFGIVVGDLKRPDYAATLAWRLLDAVAQPVDFSGQQLLTEASIGIALSSTGDGEPDRLMKKADLALYRAKTDGRATFRFFEEDMDARAQARRALEIDLRQAVAKDQLELHYQAQVDVQTEEVLGFEALVRWRHPEQGLIPPSEFIPLAEETGIILRLGEWVLRRACLDAMSWPESIRVAVNVSAAQFKHRDLSRAVAAILEETGLAPDRLELEITESLLLRDVEANLDTLHRLKALGIRISMDDFGTGYSSLGNLRSFPFDRIKIDRSFVGDLGKSTDSAAIIRAVLGLGRSLDMATTAEGVETREQLAYLRKEGCTEVQGYYFSKPKPAAEITAMLTGNGSRPTFRLTPDGAESTSTDKRGGRGAKG